VTEQTIIWPPSVGGIEDRGKAMMPTLARSLTAMGATLRIAAHFPDDFDRKPTS
jgi:hypothetical protein